MDTKLTLTLDKDVIEKAKQFAHNNKQSLSDLVENYLKLFQDTTNEQEMGSDSKILLSKGVFKEPTNFKYQKEITDRLTKKYL